MGNGDCLHGSRRRFLTSAGLACAALTTTLWLPKSSRGAPTGSVKRVIIVLCGGGVRWTSTFDGQEDPSINPWGVAPWGALGSSAPAPSWGFGRMLMQVPVSQGATDWEGDIFPHLSSDDFYNTQHSVLPSWDGAVMPTFADIAHETAVVRLNNNPAGEVNVDHNAAGICLFTGSTAGGSAGMATSIYEALKRQLGANIDQYYPLPPIATGGGAGFGVGVGDWASSRPIALPTATLLPTRDPTKSVSAWGRRAELTLDADFGASLPDYNARKVADFINDKHNAELYGGPLLEPALRVLDNPGEALGETVGDVALTNQMLLELFGVQSAVTTPGDILFDAYASENKSSWDIDWFGYNAAFAVRMIQMGAPVVAVEAMDQLFDTHAGEVVGDARGSHAFHIVRLARSLAALEFALKNVRDPQDASATLWDSTVVVVCSEFGRTPGFNVGGANGGGSDHHYWSGWPVLGGPVVQAGAGGKLITDTVHDGFFHQNRFFTTLMAAMGVEEENSTYLPYQFFPPIQGLFEGV